MSEDGFKNSISKVAVMHRRETERESTKIRAEAIWLSRLFSPSKNKTNYLVPRLSPEISQNSKLSL